jgi:hypothetical protein
MSRQVTKTSKTFDDVEVRNCRFGAPMLRRRGRSMLVATLHDVLTRSSNHVSKDLNQPLPSAKFDGKDLNRENGVNPPLTPTIVDDHDFYYRTRSMKHGMPQIADKYDTTSFENINLKSIMTTTTFKEVTHTIGPIENINPVINSRSLNKHPHRIHKAASKHKHKYKAQLQISIISKGNDPLSDSQKCDRRTSSRITGNSARSTTKTNILPFPPVMPVTEESSFSDQSSANNGSEQITGRRPASDEMLQSNVPKRICVINNLAKRISVVPSTSRPTRRRVPTDFYSPSDLSVIFKFESRKSVSRTIQEAFDIDQTPIKSNRTESESEDSDRHRETMTSTDMISFHTLLWEYDHLVAQGRCHHVSFGSTLPSALLAIDRTLQKLKSETNSNEILDDEISADIREYKRSLRAFSVYEDREKLALVHEVQEKMELWGRQCATANKWNYNKSNDRRFNDTYQCIESAMLKNRPIVITNSNRMLSRNSFKCKDGAYCIFQCNENKSGRACDAIFTPNDIAPIPTVEPFHIDDDSEMMLCLSPNNKCQWTTASSTKNSLTTSSWNRYNKTMKSKFTIDALTELKNSLNFIETYRRGSAIFSLSDEAE